MISNSITCMVKKQKQKCEFSQVCCFWGQEWNQPSPQLHLRGDFSLQRLPLSSRFPHQWEEMRSQCGSLTEAPNGKTDQIMASDPYSWRAIDWKGPACWTLRLYVMWASDLPEVKSHSSLMLHNWKSSYNLRRSSISCKKVKNYFSTTHGCVIS